MLKVGALPANLLFFFLSGMGLLLANPSANADASAAKKGQEPFHEVFGEFGMYVGDANKAAFHAVGGYAVHLSEAIWLGIDGTWGRVALPTVGTPALSGRRFWMVAPTFYWNLPILLNYTDRADLFTSLSVGFLRDGGQGEIFGNIGGGLFYRLPMNWLACRFELRNYIYRQTGPGGARRTVTDLSVNLGISLIF